MKTVPTRPETHCTGVNDCLVCLVIKVRAKGAVSRQLALSASGVRQRFQGSSALGIIGKNVPDDHNPNQSS